MKNETEVLCHLINVCSESLGFYQTAARQARDSHIESVFKNMAYIHNNIIVDLSEFVEAQGGCRPCPLPKPAAAKAGEESYFDLPPGAKSLLSDRDADKILVSRLNEAEETTLNEFLDAMAENIPPYTKAVLSHKLCTLRETNDYMKTLKKRMDSSTIM